MFVKNLSVSRAVWQVTRSHFCCLSVSSELVWVVVIRWWLVLAKWNWRFFAQSVALCFCRRWQVCREKEKKTSGLTLFWWGKERDQIRSAQINCPWRQSSGDRFLIFCFDMNAEDMISLGSSWGFCSVLWSHAAAAASAASKLSSLPVFIFICRLHWQFI